MLKPGGDTLQEKGFAQVSLGCGGRRSAGEVFWDLGSAEIQHKSE